MSKVIAIHGLIGHGKDTFASFLCNELNNEYDVNVEKRMFAYAVKKNIEQITHIKMKSDNSTSYSNLVEDYTREQKQIHIPFFNKTVGELLQFYATELCRDQLHKDIWVYSCWHSVNKSDKVVTIITDLRFENEVNFLKNNTNTLLIKIIRDVEKEEGRDHSHESEKGLPDSMFDIIIDNNGSLDSLNAKAKDLAGVLYRDLVKHL